MLGLDTGFSAKSAKEEAAGPSEGDLAAGGTGFRVRRSHRADSGSQEGDTPLGQKSLCLSESFAQF